jgi:cysteine desulfurase/selenocysteine lyase
LRYVLRIGIDNIRQMNMRVARVLREETSKIPGVELYGPEDENKRSSIVTFMPPRGADSSALAKRLEQNNIVFAARDVGGGKRAVRAAPHFFNSEEEAITAASYVKNLVK